MNDTSHLNLFALDPKDDSVIAKKQVAKIEAGLFGLGRDFTTEGRGPQGLDFLLNFPIPFGRSAAPLAGNVGVVGLDVIFRARSESNAVSSAHAQTPQSIPQPAGPCRHVVGPPRGRPGGRS